MSLKNEREVLYGLRIRMQRDNVDHHTSVTNSILTLYTSLAHENKIMDALAASTQKIKVHKEQLKNVVMDLSKTNEELLLAKGQNFEINKRLVKIEETKGAPYGYYISKIMDVKLKLILTKMNVISDGF